MFLYCKTVFNVIIIRRITRISFSNKMKVSHRKLDHQHILLETWRCTTQTPFQEGTLHPVPMSAVNAGPRGGQRLRVCLSFCTQVMPFSRYHQPRTEQGHDKEPCHRVPNTRLFQNQQSLLQVPIGLRDLSDLHHNSTCWLPARSHFLPFPFKVLTPSRPSASQLGLRVCPSENPGHAIADSWSKKAGSRDTVDG